MANCSGRVFFVRWSRRAPRNRVRKSLSFRNFVTENDEPSYRASLVSRLDFCIVECAYRRRDARVSRTYSKSVERLYRRRARHHALIENPTRSRKRASRISKFHPRTEDNIIETMRVHRIGGGWRRDSIGLLAFSEWKKIRYQSSAGRIFVHRKS